MEKKVLVFATNNLHKLEEIRAILADRFDIRSLKDIGCFDEIEETADTLEGNALIKARHVYNNYNVDCFADDTGLEVEALGGAPGVYTARYAGEGCNPEDNIEKLIRELKDEPNRKASFRTVIALIRGGKEEVFEGRVDGEILREKTGEDGFGYDPIFAPVEYGKSFAELGVDIKNKISHRARAVAKLVEVL